MPGGGGADGAALADATADADATGAGTLTEAIGEDAGEAEATGTADGGGGAGSGARDVEHDASSSARGQAEGRIDGVPTSKFEPWRSPAPAPNPRFETEGPVVGTAMDLLTVPDGKDPLQHREEQTAQYQARTFDMIRTGWRCTTCNADAAPPPVVVVPLSPYRDFRSAVATVGEACRTIYGNGAEHRCTRCGAVASLLYADLFTYSSAIGRDLIVRDAPGAEAQLFSWSLAQGPTPHAWTADLDRAIARDALVRTVAAQKSEDHDVALENLVELARNFPGDSDLLKFLPWLNGVGDLELSRQIATAHVREKPDDADGHFWLAQATIEEVGAGRAPKDAIAAAVPELERAVALRPDYPDAQIGLANVARIRGRDDDAERALRALIANHPEHPEGNYTLGLVLLPKNAAEALGCFERGEKSSPEDADYPRSRARALIALGRTDEAKLAIARARELSPNDPRIEQVASQIAGASPMAKTMTRVIQGIVALVLVGTLAGVAWIVVSSMKNKDVPASAPPSPTTSAKAPGATPPAAPPATKKK